MESITFVIPVNSNEVYKRNFLASPLFCGNHSHQFLPQRNFSSATEAYNAGIDQAKNDLMIFAHQDMYFPELWLEDLAKALKYLDQRDPLWGVLGCFGVAKEKRWGFLYDSGQRKMLGAPFEHPMEVQTIDEIVMIFRKSSGLRFNESLTHFHFYGTDICMAAADKGRKNYAISAFCIHNTNQIVYFPKEFYECYHRVKKIYKEYLPIYTSCIRISRFNIDVYKRRMRETYNRLVNKNKKPTFRTQDPRILLKELQERK